MLESRRIGQVGFLYIGMLLNLGLGIATSVINTRLLGPVQFGNFKFLQGLFEFVTILMTLGVFASGSMVLAQKADKRQRQEIIGSLIVAAAGLYLVAAIVLLIFSYFENAIFKNELGSLLRLSLPLFFVFPFKIFLEKSLQGENKIIDLSLLQFSPQILYAIFALSAYYISSLYLENAVILYLLALAIVVISLTLRLAPKFTNLKNNFKYLIVEKGNYGNNVYLSQLAGIGSSQLSILFIAYYVSTESVGYFYLASTVCYPLTMIPVVMGKVMFRDFATCSRIPFQTTFFSLIISAVSLIGFLMIVKPFMILFFTDKYLPAVNLCYYIAIGSIAHGFGDYINFFMGAHGYGVEIRNAAIFVGLVNIIGYGLLVNLMGLNGAVLTKVTASIVYCGVVFLYYWNATRRHSGRI